MKADKDDAPEYLRRKRSQNLGKWALPIALGLGLSGLALHMAGSKLLFLPQSQANHLSYPENSTRISNYNALEKQPQKTSEELFWESVNARNKSNQPKQTAYDDSNYTPTGAVNVVSMEAMRQSNGYRNPSTSRKKKTTNRIQHTGAWVNKWSGGARYYAEWVVIENYIENTSVCANHKRGSIDYRECRKGAKQFFKEQCRAWEKKWQNDRKNKNEQIRIRYCSAANSFSPMG
ncbi:hypothetical protein ACM7YN_31120 [Pseudomonas aeruginosa]|uniref:hypothetical protein n=1 Tax=Pseudomonas aeruginosa TaxID=287 RepID=UPI000F545239|nr:hypothetical protein [Pseudomonas aeruginosa]MCO3037651.1 hypothetical protein [Pseudomonas aeruginosa]HBO5517154.1 hypothetical protein [Pseudomonas aeruginosa]HBP1186162.1 hypothetical protein [Pseudomonas aeruginosa]HBP1186875.1 hypothetical protein [Pseudomonas aeruginosa]